jgi:hypothetical protein
VISQLLLKEFLIRQVLRSRVNKEEPKHAIPYWRAMDKYDVGIVGLGWADKRRVEGIQHIGFGHLYAACELNKE